ncbi:Rhamnulose-1-phosphate aldolase [Citrobacter freundii]|uniref:Rhamnulose-1-phosphate aldolase n=1 Tax=Citrobacter freundii TaxID=546 RepID=A0A7G2IMH8_CITFR|nr:Rhamnulose-1-phosphate aldolase [Citrobacter freundii]
MQNITTSWFVQGMIKATSDAWLKGWDERNGGNLTLRLDEADIAPFSADFHEKPRYIALSQPMPLLANTPFIVTGSGKFFPQRPARSSSQFGRGENRQRRCGLPHPLGPESRGSTDL